MSIHLVCVCYTERKKGNKKRKGERVRKKSKKNVRKKRKERAMYTAMLLVS